MSKKSLIKLTACIFISSSLLLSACGDGDKNDSNKKDGDQKEFTLNNYNCSEEGFKVYEDALVKNMGNDKNAALDVMARLDLMKKQCRNNKLGQFNPKLIDLYAESARCGFEDNIKECSDVYDKQIKELKEQWKKEK